MRSSVKEQHAKFAKSVESLTPNHLLTMKTKIILQPPGNFRRNDLYFRKRWRRMLYLTNECWSRWHKEYIQNLQVRQRWVRSVLNCRKGDIVLMF